VKVFCDTNVLISTFTRRRLGDDLFRLVVAEHELLTGLTGFRRGFPERVEVASAEIARSMSPS